MTSEMAQGRHGICECRWTKQDWLAESDDCRTASAKEMASADPNLTVVKLAKERAEYAGMKFREFPYVEK